MHKYLSMQFGKIYIGKYKYHIYIEREHIMMDFFTYI